MAGKFVNAKNYYSGCDFIEQSTKSNTLNRESIFRRGENKKVCYVKGNKKLSFRFLGINGTFLIKCVPGTAAAESPFLNDLRFT